MSVDNLQYEKSLIENGFSLIAGVDEVGRGCLAGPVVSCCVIMPLEKDFIINGITDSKKLTPLKREQLYNQILKTCISYKISSVDNDTIDKINILNATKLSMENAIKSIPITPDHILIDAISLDNIKIKQTPIIKGDFFSYSIACASILAKVWRDKLMVDMDLKIPGYDFAKHKGYGTKLHMKALTSLGISVLHRKSFCKKFI